MSATNRGSKRIESDFYKTPEAVIHKFLDNYNLDMNGLSILEPAAGDGSFCKVIKERYPKSYIIANELREEEKDNLSKYADKVYNVDFLTSGWEEYDVIIGNPPYSLALEFMEQCIKIAKHQTKPVKIIMLLRTAFLESKKRYNFWQIYPVNELYVLSERPSFMNNGKTDATSYSFFVWDGTKDQKIKVI